MELQERVLEMKADQKDYSAETLVAMQEQTTNLKTVGCFYQEIIAHCKADTKCGNRLVYLNSCLLYTSYFDGKKGLHQSFHIYILHKFVVFYFGDESHICTEGYVPYGWQFRGEDVYIPSQRGYRLNIFGMIDRNNRYEGFTTDESITAEKRCV